MIIETQATLVNKQSLTQDTRLLTFQVETEEEFSFTPGQFVMINVDPTDKKMTRAFSIASIPNEQDLIELCVKVIPNGAVSSQLDKINIHETVNMKGPYGSFMLQKPTRPIVLIACGTGIAPLRSMLRSLAEQQTQQPISLFFRFKTEADYLFHGEFEALKNKLPQLKLIPSVSTPSPTWEGETERIQHIITNHITDFANVDVYLCGPPEMVKDTIPALEKYGCPLGNIHKEAW